MGLITLVQQDGRCTEAGRGNRKNLIQLINELKIHATILHCQQN
jgi:hypothetical protein